MVLEIGLVRVLGNAVFSVMFAVISGFFHLSVDDAVVIAMRFASIDKRGLLGFQGILQLLEVELGLEFVDTFLNLALFLGVRGGVEGIVGGLGEGVEGVFEIEGHQISIGGHGFKCIIKSAESGPPE